MQIESFFDPRTFTFSYVVADLATLKCAVIDPVLDYSPASGRMAYDNADRIITFIQNAGFTVDWILETHVHADHISAAPYIQEALGGQIAIGDNIGAVQSTFGALFNAEEGFAVDGSQFGHLFSDAETFAVGSIRASVLHTPGHTPACVTYIIGDAAFVGDTLFMPDYGTARCDFPGGDADQLFVSIQKILSLPENTRLFMCHDYLPAERDHYQCETTVGDQKRHNIHIHDGIGRQAFVDARQAKDKTLNAPALLLPSVQLNMRAGNLPPAENNGTHYLKIPLNKI
ncbi:putative metallo-hydrolase [BD1-7 clade bacterium]|uniref:Putative metallo-hydrolase n=1 Tax=BD1-7 clade bacterium TaxID=2029982 RepID=A0A5S9QWL4_9GAMM|nr:putative metallo-hydrolase [BD1-7 clade bacterium]